MKLTYNTFKQGMEILSLSYLEWKFDIENEKMMATWYSRLANMISDEEFLRVINQYSNTVEKGPNSPLELKMRYAENCIDAPTPSVVAQALIEAPRRMLSSNFMYENPSTEEQKEYILNDLILHYPAFRNEHVRTVIISLTNDYFEVLIDTVDRCDETGVSILKTELKSSYDKRLYKVMSRAEISGNLLEASNALLLN